MAGGAASPEVFAAIAREVAQVLGMALVVIWRNEPDGSATVVGAWGDRPHPFQAGSTWPVEERTAAALLPEIGRPARIEDFGAIGGVIPDAIAATGIRSGTGAAIVVDGEFWGVMGAGVAEAEPMRDHIEDRLAEFTELVATAISNTEARKELAASRARIVAATDEERRRVVRDLHDGAQQRLVHTIITLKLARRASQDEDGAPALLTEALDNAEQATAELRELAHGILPAVLTQGGLRAGVDALASRMPVPVENGVSVGRLPAAIEATAYFVVAEALTNVAKHARAGRAAVDGARRGRHAPGPGARRRRRRRPARRERARRAGGPARRPRRPAPGREPGRRRHARRRGHPPPGLVAAHSERSSSGATPHASRAPARSRIQGGGPQRKKRASRGTPRSRSDRERHVPLGVVVAAQHVGRGRAAVADVRAGAGQGGDVPAHLVGERVLRRGRARRGSTRRRGRCARSAARRASRAPASRRCPR